MRTTPKNTSLNRLCWTCLGRFEQLDEKNRTEVYRTHRGVMGLVHCVTSNMCTPKAKTRSILEDFADYLVSEFSATIR